MSAFEADRFNHSRTSPRRTNRTLSTASIVAGAFGPSRQNHPRSGFRLRTPAALHARKPAQFQPLTHLSASDKLLFLVLVCPLPKAFVTVSLSDDFEKMPAALPRSALPEPRLEPQFDDLIADV